MTKRSSGTIHAPATELGTCPTKRCLQTSRHSARHSASLLSLPGVTLRVHHGVHLPKPPATGPPWRSRPMMRPMPMTPQLVSPPAPSYPMGDGSLLVGGAQNWGEGGKGRESQAPQEKNRSELELAHPSSFWSSAGRKQRRFETELSSHDMHVHPPHWNWTACFVWQWTGLAAGQSKSLGGFCRIDVS